MKYAAALLAAASVVYAQQQAGVGVKEIVSRRRPHLTILSGMAAMWRN